MFELALYEAKNRVKGGIYLSIGLSILAAFVIWAYPSFSEAFEDDELLEAYPEQILQLFDVETMASLEGFLAFELYVFGWVILLGLYFAYACSSMIADDVDRERMDITLSLPISRSSVVLQKYLSILVPITLVNVLTPIVVYVGAIWIDEPIPAVDLLAIHLLSIPYLLVCAGIGLLASVVFDRASIAQRVALGVTFGLFMLESLLVGTDFEAVGVIAPMRYFDPNEILLEGTYNLEGVAILLVMTAALVGASRLWFSRVDI
ncbi:ABC transporter permease [Natrialbaceae archaeon A-CW2]|uniref:ABC transporter permease n=1 Tax=Natronosalvus amylolyticus TaxID=2961994 RepID=UPI0020C9811E|nr:ABC transporter permease subunit [Natronosalvus amylolyticus]